MNRMSILLKKISYEPHDFKVIESEQFLEILIYRSDKNIENLINESMKLLCPNREEFYGYRLIKVSETDFFKSFKAFGGDETVGKIKKVLEKESHGKTVKANLIKFDDDSLEMVGILNTDANSIFIYWYTTA